MMIRTATSNTTARLAVRSLRSHSTHASKQCNRIPLQQQPPIQPQTVALSKQSKSTLALDCSVRKAPSLSKDQVRSVFLSAAIPMVGFGFMDNFVMITAGSAIDNTLGVQMGLATMTAAAMGQVVSDVSGVLFGDTMARAFRVKPARLSEAQKKLAVVGRLRLGGAVLGVILGCTLGATALSLIPNDREDAPEALPSPAASAAAAAAVPDAHLIRDQLDRLQKVVHDHMTSEDDTWHEKLASCTLYVGDVPESCLPAAATSSRALSFFAAKEEPARATVASLERALGDDPEVGHTLNEGRVVVFADTIYLPVTGNTDEEVLGILKIQLGQGSFYTGSEIKDAKKVARNLGFFLNHMVVRR